MRQILEREHELAELGAAAWQAKDGDGSVALILGEAGIGKSSLVEGIRAVLPAEGGCWSATVTTWPPRGCWGRCVI